MNATASLRASGGRAVYHMAAVLCLVAHGKSVESVAKCPVQIVKFKKSY